MGSRVQPGASPLERHVLVDEEGRGLRVTWRPDRGFVNLSVWRGQRCVETFHLTPSDAGQLISFLAATLTSAVPTPPRTHLRLADDGRASPSPAQRPVIAWLRAGVADRLDRAARRLRI